jgi:2OG-Fe(II) oxygenase superfamily
MEPWTIPLAHILHQRRWQVCSEPFPHMVAYNVFTPEFYAWLDRAFGDILGRGLSERHDPAMFSRNIAGYDAYSTTFNDEMPAPFHLFTSHPWHHMIANLVGIRVTGDVNGGFHHHAPGSKSGHVHNDLNPGWFLNETHPHRVNISRNELCNYSTGKVRAGYHGHQTMRAIAVLFYLHNPPWEPGDGGETGLYSSREQPVSEPAKRIPPINNSLFLFECRPNSYHSFIENWKSPRNSMIMWLHCPFEDVVQRWGDKAVVYWSKRPKNQPL